MAYLTDPLTLLFFVIFAFAGFRLWQVLGHRSGTEKPLDAAPIQTRPLPSDLELKAVDAKSRKIWDGYAKDGSALAKGLSAIADADPLFDTAQFLEGATSAHERILNAFAAGDLPTLKLLLIPSTYNTFEAAITKRNAAGETTVFKFVGVKETAVDHAVLMAGGAAEITVRFVTEVISAVKDKTGKLLVGDDMHIADVKELWIFARDLKDSGAGWKLSETHDGA